MNKKDIDDKMDIADSVLPRLLFWATVVMGILAPLSSVAQAMFWPSLFFVLIFGLAEAMIDK